jgi:hypothetical protein
MTPQQESKFQIAIFGDTEGRKWRVEDLDCVEWLFASKSGESTVEFSRDESIISTVDLRSPRLELSSLLAILVVGSEEEFQDLSERWKSSLPSSGVLFRRIPERSPQALLSAAVECIGEHLDQQRRYSGLVSLELAAYRREFERLQRSFARLEEFVGRHTHREVEQIFEYPPDIDASTGIRRRAVHDELDENTFIQTLPVDSFGFSGLSIYVDSKPESLDDPLRLRLRAVETSSLIAEWSLAPAEASIGWAELVLITAIDEPALTLELVAEWMPESTGWALALGPPHPYKDFCVRDKANRSLSAPLAMRLFSGLPGVRVPATTGSFRPVNAPSLLARPFPIEAYSTVAQVLPATQAQMSTLVSYDREIYALTVHPHKGGVTVARMDVHLPKEAWGVTAHIQLANERAGMTDFAMFICLSRDQSKELARLHQLDSPSPSFSGWRTLAPLEKGAVSIVLPDQSEEQKSLYLLTRQSPDLNPDFAWARFSRFEFNILPNSVVDLHEASGKQPTAEAASHVETYAVTSFQK